VVGCSGEVLSPASAASCVLASRATTVVKLLAFCRSSGVKHDASFVALEVVVHTSGVS